MEVHLHVFDFLEIACEIISVLKTSIASQTRLLRFKDVPTSPIFIALWSHVIVLHHTPTCSIPAILDVFKTFIKVFIVIHFLELGLDVLAA